VLGGDDAAVPKGHDPDMALALFHQTSDARLSRLAGCPVMKGASRAELVNVGRILDEAAIHAGERICDPVDPPVLAIVVDGTVTDGDRILGVGESFGVDVVLNGAEQRTWWALTDATVLIADARRARQALNESSTLAIGLLRSMAATAVA
jgi:CRP-like cAMP-binding protein